jgi:hypothetical protein
MQVELVDEEVVVEGGKVLEVLGVGEGVGEGKVDFLGLVFEEVLEYTF